MMKHYVGRKVKARVTRIEEYALYLTFEGIEIIVLIPDVSTEPTHLKADWRVGDDALVSIVQYVEQYGLYKGAIADAQEDGAS